MTHFRTESDPRATPSGMGAFDCDHEQVGSLRLLLSPDEAALALSVSRSKVYRLLRRGHLESVMLGGSRRIPLASLERLVEVLLAEARGTRECPHSGSEGAP